MAPETGQYTPVRKCSQVLGGSRKVQVALETGQDSRHLRGCVVRFREASLRPRWHQRQDRTVHTCEEVQSGPRRLQEGPGGTRDKARQQTPDRKCN